MNFGYIKLHRQVRDNPLFKERRVFSKFEAWVDILLSCNYNDAEFLLGYEIYQVIAGSFITSKKSLHEKYGWGKQKLNNYLNFLEKLGMISVQTIGAGNQKATQIFVINFKKYQIDGIKDNKKKKTQIDDNYGDIEINDLQNFIKKQIEKKGLVYKANNQERIRIKNIISSKEINIIKDKHKMNTYEFVEYILKLAFNSSFWNGKIDSGEAIYKYYGKILNEYKSNLMLEQGTMDIDFLNDNYGLTNSQVKKVKDICHNRKQTGKKISKEIFSIIVEKVKNGEC